MRHIFIPTVVALLAIVPVACEAPAPEVNGSGQNAETLAARRVVRIKSQVLEPTSFSEVIELTGSVEAADDAVLSAQSSGSVVSLAPLGSTVRRGASVARLDDDLARAAVEQAQATVESAQAQYELSESVLQRQEPLYRDSIISAVEIENVRTQRNQALAGLNQSRALLAQAEKQLSYTRVVAPFTGIVESHAVERGEQVLPGQPVARIVSATDVKIIVGVPERYAGDLSLRTKVQAGFSAYGIQRLDGRVIFVGNVIDTASRTFRVEIDVPNRDRSLKPEMTAKVFLTRKTLDEVLVIPMDAVIRDENGASAFVVDRSGGNPTAVRRQLRLGSSYGGRVVVIDGLMPGDELIVAGQTNVAPDDAVDVVTEGDGDRSPVATPAEDSFSV